MLAMFRRFQVLIRFWKTAAVFLVMTAAVVLNFHLGGDWTGVVLAGVPGIWAQYNTRKADGSDIVPWVYWDTNTYTSGTTTISTFFGTARPNGNDLGNMPMAGTLPNPYSFLVRVPRFFIKGQVWARNQAATGAANVGGLNDAQLLGRTGVFTFTIGAKVVFQSPLWMVSAGGGAFGYLADAGAAATNVAVSYGQVGGVNPRDVLTLWRPLVIDSVINFNVTLSWPAGAVTLDQGNTDIAVALDGERCGPIQ